MASGASRRGKMTMLNSLHQLRRPPATRRQPSQLPRDQRLPAVYRLLPAATDDRAFNDPLARDRALANLEAVLLVADEPLPARRLAQAAGLADAGVARRLLKKLRDL